SPGMPAPGFFQSRSSKRGRCPDLSRKYVCRARLGIATLSGKGTGSPAFDNKAPQCGGLWSPDAHIIDRAQIGAPGLMIDLAQDVASDGIVAKCDVRIFRHERLKKRRIEAFGGDRRRGEFA